MCGPAHAIRGECSCARGAGMQHKRLLAVPKESNISAGLLPGNLQGRTPRRGPPPSARHDPDCRDMNETDTIADTIPEHGSPVARAEACAALFGRVRTAV